VLLLPAGPAAAQGERASGRGGDGGWPREYVRDDARIVLYQPQVESWKDYVDLRARLAVSASSAPEARAVFGSVLIEVATVVDFGTRTVHLGEIKALDIEFPGEKESARQEVRDLVESVVVDADAIALDRVLANLSHSQVTQGQERLNLDPPPIFYTEDDAILVIFDGEPAFGPVSDEGDLEFAVNTNWAVFRSRDENRYFLLDEDTWLEAGDLMGEWQPAKVLPRSFRSLPEDENWKDVRSHVPGKEITKEQMPRVFVSFRPAEMIRVDGKPGLQPLGSTGLLYVENTESDLFLHLEQQEYYVLLSGRWFRSPDPAGPWTAATEALPENFGRIDPKHEMAHVLVSVPGTPEAEEAAIQAQIPQQADVDRDTTVEVTYDGEAQFETIEDTEMQRATNTSFDVIVVGGSYYTCHQAVWFVSTSANGPWLICDAVPTVIYTIPPSSPVHHVTYVRVYGSSSTTVVFGYTSGYTGVYVYNGCVMYGVGYYWPPYIYYPPYYAYPVYYPYRYATYGCGAWYNPYRGAYVRGGVAYGPYGGFGRGASYNPHTGTYARGAGAWGPAGGTWAAEAWNPRTGTYAQTRQSVDPYKQWGSSVVTRGSEWARTGHVTTREGTAAGFETSRGRRGVGYRGDEGRGGFVTRNDAGDVYVGRDGNVYRRDGDDWQRHEDGEWRQVESDRDGDRISGERSEQTRERAQQEITAEQRARARERAQDRAASRDGKGIRSAERLDRDPTTRQQLERDRQARRRGDDRTQQLRERRGRGRRDLGGSRRGIRGRRRG
jgi:hypothetical protein